MRLDVIPIVISLAWLQVELDRDFAKREVISEEVQEVPSVLVREALGGIANQNDGRRLRCDLGRVVDSWSFELVEGWFVPFQGGLNEFVEHARRDPFLGLLEEHLRVVQERFDVFTRLPGDESDWAIGHGRKVFADVFDPSFGRDLAGEFVPFVDHEDAGFELIVDVVSELFVDFAHLLGAIEEQEHHISASDAALGTVGSVPIDVGFDAFASA